MRITIVEPTFAAGLRLLAEPRCRVTTEVPYALARVRGCQMRHFTREAFETSRNGKRLARAPVLRANAFPAS